MTPYFWSIWCDWWRLLTYSFPAQWHPSNLRSVSPSLDRRRSKVTCPSCCECVIATWYEQKIGPRVELNIPELRTRNRHREQSSRVRPNHKLNKIGILPSVSCRPESVSRSPGGHQRVTKDIHQGRGHQGRSLLMILMTMNGKGNCCCWNGSWEESVCGWVTKLNFHSNEVQLFTVQLHIMCAQCCYFFWVNWTAFNIQPHPLPNARVCTSSYCCIDSFWRIVQKMADDLFYYEGTIGILLRYWRHCQMIEQEFNII